MQIFTSQYGTLVNQVNKEQRQETNYANWENALSKPKDALSNGEEIIPRVIQEMKYFSVLSSQSRNFL